MMAVSKSSAVWGGKILGSVVLAVIVKQEDPLFIRTRKKHLRLDN
jgi:hypothetical protein